MYAQVDDEGYQFQLLHEIQDHRKNDTAIPKEGGMIRSANGTVRNKVTTRGWELLVLWKDGSTKWIKLNELKESNPVEVAEYAVANRIQDEPAFKWWVPQVLRRRNRMISKVKSKYWSKTHKFGIRLPKTVEEALRFDNVFPKRPEDRKPNTKVKRSRITLMKKKFLEKILYDKSTKKYNPTDMEKDTKRYLEAAVEGGLHDGYIQQNIFEKFDFEAERDEERKKREDEAGAKAASPQGGGDTESVKRGERNNSSDLLIKFNKMLKRNFF